MQDSPFQKGEQMDILKEKIDANSFQTMKHIIFLTSTKNDKIRYFEKEEADKRFLPIGKEQKEEDAYTFQYPGEMLERYEEKIGDTVQIRRALAFALVTMSDFHEAQMYVGTQYENFLKPINRFFYPEKQLQDLVWLQMKFQKIHLIIFPSVIKFLNSDTLP